MNFENIYQLYLNSGILVSVFLTFFLFILWFVFFEKIIQIYFLFYSKRYQLKKDCNQYPLAKNELKKNNSIRQFWQNNYLYKYPNQYHVFLIQELKSYLNYKLSFSTSYIRTIIIVSPMCGLLGTVMGMIDIFNALNISNAYSTEFLASGIAKAIFSTVFGLIVSLTGIFLNTFLLRVSNRVINKIINSYVSIYK